MDTYRTITSTSNGIYKDKGSKFLSFVYPVNSETEIPPIISSLKKEHFTARHHCYAWRLGAKGERTRMVDDGEPSSTAGKPILGQILSNELTNILIVVVRYFGGTKLGVSGLIQAYKQAAADAIEQAEIVEKTVDAYYDISFDYLMMNDVMKIIKEIAPNVLKQTFDNECRMLLSIRLDQKSMLEERLSKIDDLSIVHTESR